jgi:hypothetical protein
MKINFPLGFNRVFAVPALILLFMNVLVELLLVYLLYRFIAGFLVPVYRTARQMRGQFRNMNGQQRADGPASTPPNSSGNSAKDHTARPGSTTTKVGEYIDFEEVK